MLELVVVLFVIMAVSTVAIPRLTEAWDDYRLTAVTGSVSGVMARARVLSVSRNEDIRVYVSDTSTYELQTESSPGTWTTLVRNPDADAADQVSESYQLPGGFLFGAAGSINEFHSRGNATPVATLTVTNPNGTTRDIVVELSGRSYTQ
jgi:Tfp pilus assembly protein FimT